MMMMMIDDDDVGVLRRTFPVESYPRIYDARTSRIRKTFMSSVGLITERYMARMRFSLQNNITYLIRAGCS